MTDSTTDAVDAIAAQWRRERPDLDLEAMAVLGRLARLEAVARREVEAVFTAHGLQRGEFDVLAALRRAGDPFELNPSVLADTLMLSRAGMTGRLDRLESAGLVRRIADAADRRAIRVALTEAGRTLIDTVVTAHTANETRLLAVLSAADRRELDRIVRILLTGLESDTPDPGLVAGTMGVARCSGPGLGPVIP
ncbi:MarR family winged helix-turn-helix transcriptional regulator [Nocardia cyriacigeorgica]|uniref:MarR family transcriptional regulator n=2 Tax=Nocardia cyriacigeorgica TaxID=135487 RepID=A0A6P1D3Z9_9NOCA|nr:MarR family transcriptional regulator [Nocardia cyriacigeorgica]NEW42892.1 MarR family transcriptional regulator [Nocardia cyriacigeorgica]